MRAFFACSFLLAGVASAQATPTASSTPATPSSTTPATERAAVVAPPAKVRVFVAPIAAGAGADPAVVTLLEGRVLSAAKRLADFDVIAARDVTALVDVAAVRAASGCTDGISCESEIASALDAPQLVTGELGRVGDTWLLSLARTERTTSSVLARVTVDARGDTPEGLLSKIDGAVAELFGAAVAGDVDVGFVVGAVGVGVGVGGLVVGTVAAVWSNLHFANTESALGAEDDAAKRESLRRDATDFGNGLNTAALIGWAAGGVVTAVGVGVLVVDAVGGE